MNKVIVKINSKQKGSEENVVKMEVVANHHKKGDISYVIYKETNLVDKQETSTMLKIGKDFLALTRSGGVKQQQLFAKGKVSHSDYETPYGKLHMMVKTHRFDIISDVKHHIIKIDYALYINNSWQSDNELVIKIKPAN